MKEFVCDLCKLGIVIVPAQGHVECLLLLSWMQTRGQAGKTTPHGLSSLNIQLGGNEQRQS